MIRKFTNYVLMGAMWFTAVNCDKDDIAKPPKPLLSVDQNTGLVGDTEFTFTITQVNADAISLLPYGLPGGDGGILVKSFENGVATVKVKYSKPGTYNAIARSNNHTDDGESINTQSDPVQITITSDDNSITEFKFDKISTKTEIDQTAQTIKVIVPYGTNLTNLKATYTASGFTTLTVGSAQQTSGTTENNFTNPVTYTVTANNGTTKSYTVTVIVTEVEKKNTITSGTAKAISKAAKDKALPVAIDNASPKDSRTIVVYDTIGSPIANFDSVRIGYKLDGTLANLKYGGKKLKQDSLFNLADGNIEQFTVHPEDSLGATGVATYKVYATRAPKLKLAFPALNPGPLGINKPTNFDYNIKVLSGTNTSAISTTVTAVELPAGVTLNSIKVVGGPTLTIGAPANVNYSIPVKIELNVTDSNIGGGVTYNAVYNVSVATLQ
jgi:hypothetical protein